MTTTTVTKAAVNYKTCTITECQKPYKARGYCRGHYIRFRTCGDPLSGPPVDMSPANPCKVADCTHPSFDSNIYCQAHYQRLWSLGNLHEDQPVSDRFSIATPGGHTARNQGCDMPTCNQPAEDRNMCTAHLKQMTGGLVCVGEW